jgi:3-oxoacyl-[acyl-carrier protein] reductase
MFSLTGKTALVTGASGGIGAAIAKTLAAAGARVAISGTNMEKLNALKNELKDAVIVPADLSNAEAVAALVDTAEKELGQLDILVNNAGLTRDTLAIRMKDEDWDAVLNVNLKAAFVLSRAALKGMMKRRNGRIISISSIVGTTGNPGQANYAASKAGLVGMTKAMAAEVAPRGVTLNCVAPGFIATNMTDALNEDQKNTINAKIPAGRMGMPEDIAAAVLYLASEEAAYVTGQTIHVNGGMAMV